MGDRPPRRGSKLPSIPRDPATEKMRDTLKGKPEHPYASKYEKAWQDEGR